MKVLLILVLLTSGNLYAFSDCSVLNKCSVEPCIGMIAKSVGNVAVVTCSKVFMFEKITGRKYFAYYELLYMNQATVNKTPFTSSNVIRLRDL